MATKKAAAAPPTPTGEVSIWERLAQPRSPRTLDHTKIAAAAVELADAEGFEAVSMRRLAGHLGVATMALYRYVSNKEDLFWLMVDAALDGVQLPTETVASWRDVARTHAQESRAALLRHPWLVELGARIPLSLTPTRLAITERALQSLDGLGLDADTCMAVLNTVSSFVWGATGVEVSQTQLMRRQGWQTRDELRNFYGPHMRFLLSTGRYPLFQRYVTEATRKDDADWRFEFGLDCILDGIATRLAI